MIIWDHAIKHLQPAGGITTWWTQHCRWMSPLINSEIMSIAWPEGEPPAPWFASQRIHGSGEQRPGFFWFLRQIKCPDSARLFHGSYFRLPVVGPRYLLTYHDAGMARIGGIRGKLHRGLQERCIKRADLIHCVSNHTKQELLSEFPWVQAGSVRVVHHGFTVERAEEEILIPAEFPFVLFVGKRSGYKNGELAFKALAACSGLTLVLVGGGKLKKSEDKLIDELGIRERVHICGQVTSGQLRWLYVHAEALWYPSANEGFGFPVLEAASVGCPVIASSGHAVEEIASDYAILHAAPTPDWIVATTENVRAKGRQHWLALGAQLVDRFTWDNYAKRMLAIYKELGVG